MARMFGTDGVRGIANEELTPLLAMQLGQAPAINAFASISPEILVSQPTMIVGLCSFSFVST